jgi:excinuclease ABC subunit B
MRRAIDETYRRRGVQTAYNEAHHLVPVGITKGIRDLSDRVKAVAEEKAEYTAVAELPREEVTRILKDLEAQMKQAAKGLDFERAAALRDQILALRRQIS